MSISSLRPGTYGLRAALAQLPAVPPECFNRTLGVTAIIPNWNRCDLLLRVLDDLRRQTLPPTRILVVDNGSTDASAEAAAQAGAHVIALPRNLGFAPAVNRGIQAASDDWIAILNNDVQLPPDWIERLLATIERAGCSYGAGKLLRAAQPSHIDATYDLLSRGGCAWRAGHGSPDGPLWAEERKVSFVPFTAALLKREVFLRVGLLDETFESYLEDVEFCLRCALAGFEGWYAPSVVARHLGSATFGEWNPRTVSLVARNQLLLVAKHFPAGRYRWNVALAQLLWGLLAARHGAARAWWNGLRQGLSRFQRTSPANIRLDQLLQSSECEIHRLQRASRFELFWRLYFSLT